MRRRLGWCLLVVGLPVGLSAVAVSTTANQWKSYASVSLRNEASGGFSFVFPGTPDAAIGYLWTSRGPRVLAGTLTMRLRVETIGFPTFRYDTEPSNTCDSPASVRPFFGRYEQRVKKLEYANRWWPRDAYAELWAGDVVVTVPLDATRAVWVPAFGWQSFEADRQDVDLLGLSFGGGCFYSHGVYVVGGSATFTVVEIDVG